MAETAKDLLQKQTGLSDSSDLPGHTCPACFSDNMYIFHKQDNVPVHSVLNIPSREKALNFPTGNIALGFCHNCGFISNVLFDASLLNYSPDCEESQGFSETFNNFARRMATQLVEKYNLYNKDILEIGCGKGEFISLLCELGENRGVGFDPAYVPGRTTPEGANRVTFIQDFYSEKYANYRADFLCCKMTLEHIHNPGEFIGMVRQTIGDTSDTVVFFQIPDVTRILRDCAIEDIYYEHCSYFSPGSLARLFRKCRFDVLRLATEYNDQYLIIEAKLTDTPTLLPLPQEDDISKLKGYVEAFQDKYQSKLLTWQRRLQEIRAKNQRLVLWGSGSKAISFLTTFRVYDGIEYVVDINPYRQGTYMAGTGQEIVNPKFLKEYRPDIVIVMNPVYQEEIQEDLRKMGLSPKVVSV